MDYYFCYKNTKTNVTATIRMYVCPVCFNEFHKVTHFKRHISLQKKYKIQCSLHVGVIEWVCPSCTTMIFHTSSMQGIKDHLLSTHSRKRKRETAAEVTEDEVTIHSSGGVQTCVSGSYIVNPMTAEITPNRDEAAVALSVISDDGASLNNHHNNAETEESVVVEEGLTVDEIYDEDYNELPCAGALDNFTVEEYQTRLSSRPYMEEKISLYDFIIEANITHRKYRQMKQLKAFRDETYAPYKLSTLQDQVSGFFKYWLPSNTVEFHDVVTNDTYEASFISFRNALAISLSDPINAERIIETNATHLPSDMTDEVEWVNLLHTIDVDILNNTRTFNSFADGSEYTRNIYNLRDHWLPNFRLAKDINITTFFCSLLIYEDDFTR